MLRKSQYRCILDAGTADNTQHINAQTSRKNRSFRPPRIETWLAPSTQKDPGEASAQCTETEHAAEPAQISSDDEDYDPEADEVDSLDDHVDNLYAKKEVVCHNKSNGRKGNDNATKPCNLFLRRWRHKNDEIERHGGYESWKTMDNALKEYVYDTIKTFLYEEDDKGKKAGDGSKARKNMEGIKKQIISQVL
ncbi:hypothetical protein AHAS_Ahas20G0109300 [Arachis hypogaea]